MFVRQIFIFQMSFVLPFDKKKQNFVPAENKTADIFFQSGGRLVHFPSLLPRKGKYIVRAVGTLGALKK